MSFVISISDLKMSSQLSIIALMTILTFGVTSAQVWQAGACPKASAISNFNISQVRTNYYPRV